MPSQESSGCDNFPTASWRTDCDARRRPYGRSDRAEDRADDCYPGVAPREIRDVEASRCRQRDHARRIIRTSKAIVYTAEPGPSNLGSVGVRINLSFGPAGRAPPAVRGHAQGRRCGPYAAALAPRAALSRAVSFSRRAWVRPRSYVIVFQSRTSNGRSANGVEQMWIAGMLSACAVSKFIEHIWVCAGQVRDQRIGTSDLVDHPRANSPDEL